MSIFSYNLAYEPQEHLLERSRQLIRTAPSRANAIGQAFPGKGSILNGSLFAALPTPFNGGVAEKAFGDLAAWQIGEGVDGLVVAGATGEGSTLTSEERLRLIRIAVQTAQNRVPVIAATGSNCTRQTILSTQAAEAAGASAALIVAPYYNIPNQYGLYRHFHEIARSVGIPIVIENDPSRTGVDILPETLLRLSALSNIVAVEHTNRDPLRLAGDTGAPRAELIQLCGDDQSSVHFQMADGQGLISAVVNVAPKLWIEMQAACRRKDWNRAMAIHRRLQPLLSALRLEPSPAPLKYALSLLRPWFSPEVRLPLVPVTYETSNAIVEALMELQLIA
jgi:4-hydroxy-tetrahydrodipicolinate synthase